MQSLAQCHRGPCLRLRPAGCQRRPPPLSAPPAAPRCDARRLQVAPVHFSILQNERPCFATNLTLHFNILQATPRPSAATESAAPGRGALQLASSPAALMLLAAELAEGTGPSYYATLGLFLLSFPGLYSLVKRSPDPKARARRPRSGRSAGRLRPASPTHPTSLPPPPARSSAKPSRCPARASRARCRSTTGRAPCSPTSSATTTTSPRPARSSPSRAQSARTAAPPPTSSSAPPSASPPAD